MTDSDLVQLEDALEVLDRRASLTLAMGGAVTIDGIELRSLIKAAYNHEREKMQRQELGFLRAGSCCLAIAATVTAVAEISGLS